MSEERIPKTDGKNVNSEFKPWEKSRDMHKKGLKIAPNFATPGVHPFDELEWETRQAKIADETGKAIFEQNDVEVPANWSQLATKVVVSKYFYGDVESGQRENSVKQLVHRVCRTIADRGQKDGYFATEEDAENFYNELTWLCVNQYGSFNSPVWFNVGLYDVYGIKGSEHNFHWDEAATKPSPARTAMNIRRPRPVSSSPSRTRWKTSCGWPAARRCSSSTAPAPAPICPPCAAAGKNFPAAASPPAP